MCNQHLTRRQFLGTSTAVTGIGSALPVMGAGSGIATPQPLSWTEHDWDPDRPYQPVSKPVQVQPILMYVVPVRKEARSWKGWGDIQSEEAAVAESKHIQEELAALAKAADFPIEILPVARVSSEEQAARAHSTGAHVTIVYPATGGGALLRACIPNANTILFVRHTSGPIYYWYEALSVRYLKTDKPEAPNPADTRRITYRDVVVDDTEELLWRLRALHGACNFLGARILAIGGPMGKYAPDAPAVARDRFRFDIVDYPYSELEKRVAQVFQDPQCLKLADRWTTQYLTRFQTKMATQRPFVLNSFLLYGLFKDLLREHDTPLYTIQNCMSTIMPMAKTTACLTLSLLNDDGPCAFCESDFVVIPPGILLYYLTRKPVFMHNSTFPHKGIVTCAHCTSPRRMNGDRFEPATITTHYESEYGAAPKVDFPVGQTVSFLSPEYSKCRWIGFRGTIQSNPEFAICRSQQDVRLDGQWRKLMQEVRDSHWIMVYGDHLKEMEYACSHLGITWDSLSESEI